MKKTNLLLLIILSWFTVFSQDQGTQESSPTDLPTILPPSPTVTSLMRFEEVPIDNYSGKPNIVFPIYTKQLAQGVVVPIALRYNTMALRVDERSGWTGTGWALDGEAVISRTVMDIADELDQVNIHPNDQGNKSVGVYHNGFFDLNWGTSSENLYNPDIQRYLWNASGRGSGQNEAVFDKKLDLYQLSLFGKSARFVVVKLTSSYPYVLSVRMLNNDSNLRISLVHNANFEIESFTVIDTNGNKYLFNVTESSDTIITSISVSQQTSDTNFSNSYSQYISAWKIKEIKTSTDIVLATFSYQSVFEEFDAPESKSYAYLKNVGVLPNFTAPPNGIDLRSVINPSGNGGTVYENHGQYAYNDGLIKPKYSAIRSNLKINTKKLDSINFYDQTNVLFILSQENHPEYTNSGKILTQIKINNNQNNVYKQFNFSYSTHFNRLYLDAIDEKFDNINNLTYNFNYNGYIPEFGSPQKDIWGYYSTQTGSEAMGGIFNNKYGADKSNVVIGALERIEYPNGGIKEFIFESNTFSHRGSQSFTDDEFANYNMDNWMGLNQVEDFDNVNGANGISDEILSFTVNRTHKLFLSPTINSTPIGNNQDPNASFKIFKVILGQQLEEVMNLPITKESVFSLPQGDYILKFFTLTMPTSNTPVYSVTGSLYYKNFETQITKIIYGGGLRIKQVNLKDVDNITAEKSKFYSYNIFDDNHATNNKSSGVIDGLLSNLKEYEMRKLYSFAIYMRASGAGRQVYVKFPQSVNTVDAVESYADYEITENLNSVYVSLTKNNYVGYGKVTVKEANNGNIVSQYTTPEDFPTYPIGYTYPFLPLKDKSFLHGALVKQEIYNKVNKKISETSYIYNEPIEIEKAKSLFITDIVGDKSCYLQYYSTYSDFLNRYPSIHREFMSQFEIHLEHDPYYPNGFAENSETEFAYVQYEFYGHYFSKYLLKDKITKQYHYDSLDTPPDPFFPVLPDPVVTTESYTYNLENYLPSIIEKTDSNNNIFKTETIYSVTGYPTSDFTSEENTNISLMIDKNMIDKPILSKSYKNNNLLSSVKATYEEFLSGLILPNKVKTSKGNDPLEDRLTYHAYDDFGNVLDVSQIEGTHISYVYGYQHQLPIAKIVNMEYADLPQSELNALLNFNYIIGTEAQLLTVLNNFRNALPENTEVTTLTYKPLIGASTITGPNGETIRYHYDNLNRLMYTEDHQGNGISKNEYHYKGQN
jgi:hypothetical protein